MEKALVSLAQKTEDKAAESKEPNSPNNPSTTQTSAQSPAPAAPVPTALKGVSQSLLDRVRTQGGGGGGWGDNQCSVIYQNVVLLWAVL